MDSWQRQRVSLRSLLRAFFGTCSSCVASSWKRTTPRRARDSVAIFCVDRGGGALVVTLTFGMGRRRDDHGHRRL